MDQDKIWDYYQNEGLGEGKFPDVRSHYMVRRLKAGQMALNIGVGSGSLEAMATKKNVHIHSLDPSEGAIDKLRERLSMGERAQVGYAQSMPFSDNFFDVVIMSEVLEHLDDDTLCASLSEVKRVLKTSGNLIASTPYRENLVANRVVCPNCSSVFHKIGHVQSFDKPTMRGLILDAGFHVDKLYVSTFIDWRRGGVKNTLKSIFRLLLARMGEGLASPHLFVIAQKEST